MPATQVPFRGPELLSAVSRAMLGFHHHYHGKGSVQARAHMLADDMLACVLRDVYNGVERDMIACGHRSLVKETRSALREAKGDELAAAVAHLSGRPVLAFMSTCHFDPDLEVQVFAMGDPTA